MSNQWLDSLQHKRHYYIQTGSQKDKRDHNEIFGAQEQQYRVLKWKE